MKSIIIDAGHGGKDGGAAAFGVKEKEWTLKISLYQYERLKELGAPVGITRTKDQTLDSINRVAKVKGKYDVCISNHWNAFDGSARGVETIHSIHAKEVFARKLADQITSDSGLPLRRVFTRTINRSKDYYYMHRLTGATETVIIEYGFLDHKGDFDTYTIDNLFYKVAEGVVKVICEKIGVTYIGRENMKEATPQSIEDRSKGKKLQSIHQGKLRYYNKPSWKDQDVFGYITEGQGFPSVIQKVKVGKAYQYQVENSKGQRFYITAHPKYVKLV